MIRTKEVREMDLKAQMGKEVMIKVANRIGILADVARALADRGINLLAIDAHALAGQAFIRLVTDDNLRAGDTLGEHGYKSQAEDVILLTVPHKPGILHRVTEILAESEIDVHHVYASTTDKGGNCCVVLHTANDAQALVKFNENRIGV
ncbi:hypothetical protein DDZ13_03660 [Coraliomargarita sinensis]|uniref:ACT domain-containing protein n=1 Tax=Coraliomargarita sinensis TaxID=2174842 RepID=A0A317ZLG7_9BACT|nr:ACT domain-containing protein [Coraliomargarita sinensis]PXA05073.1 hypothetical protein DDZ13_03660 [Coraliomargarita sinensis]